MTLKIAIVGYGKIAQDEHTQAIAASPDMDLVAIASPGVFNAPVPVYPDLAAMLASSSQFDAVVMCQPPAARFDAARMALEAGKHVLLEKPPGISVTEVRILHQMAHKAGLTLFASWHSRWSPSVAAVKQWCAANPVDAVSIVWKEDVRRWHPNQDWIWQAGGFGVLDPGINALSILTEVIAAPMRVISAKFEVPSNKVTPIAASMHLLFADEARVDVEFDWRQTGTQTWQIDFRAGEETKRFLQGGADEASGVNGGDSTLSSEYRAIYQHFETLIRHGKCDVDCRPLEIIADAYLCGEVAIVAPFED